MTARTSGRPGAVRQRSTVHPDRGSVHGRRAAHAQRAAGGLSSRVCVPHPPGIRAPRPVEYDTSCTLGTPAVRADGGATGSSQWASSSAAVVFRRINASPALDSRHRGQSLLCVTALAMARASRAPVVNAAQQWVIHSPTASAPPLAKPAAAVRYSRS
jgi:hypothetical protein